MGDVVPRVLQHPGDEPSSGGLAVGAADQYRAGVELPGELGDEIGRGALNEEAGEGSAATAAAAAGGGAQRAGRGQDEALFEHGEVTWSRACNVHKGDG